MKENVLVAFSLICKGLRPPLGKPQSVTGTISAENDFCPVESYGKQRTWQGEHGSQFIPRKNDTPLCANKLY